MKISKNFALFFRCCVKICVIFYVIFHFRPKLLTENGNLVLESANNRNITFRLKGSGSLNINNFNVRRLFEGGVNSTSSYDPSIRLNILDQRIDELRRRFMGARGVLQRLNRLESRTETISGNSNGTSVTNGRRTRTLQWRVTQLETKVDDILANLNANNCSSNPCKNGGKCANLYGAYECKYDQ